MSEPVLISGAGPVGLTMALALKQLGVPVRIIDKSAARTDKSKALVLWPRTLEMLDIRGCAQPFIDAGMKAAGARLFARRKLLAQVHLDIAHSVHAYALMLPQSDTERLLEELLDRLGVGVQRRVELTTFSDGGDAVAAVLRHADGHEETVDTGYLIACDGAHSTVRHGLAMEFEGDTLPSEWVLADVLVDGDIAHDKLSICWTPDGVLVLIPIRGNRFRVIADVPASSGPQAQAPAMEEIQALLDRRAPASLRAHDQIWLSRFRINERKVKDYRRGRVFLCGDAAHVHSPAGGQGMNTGMQDAFNLAWKLAMVWHGHATPALLDSYSPERSAIGDQVLRNAGAMTKVAILRNPLLQQIRNFSIEALSRLPAVQQRIVDQLTEMDLHYPHSPLTYAMPGAARHPAPGERAPDLPLASVTQGAARLYELLATGKFVVLSVGTAELALLEGLGALAIAARASVANAGTAGSGTGAAAGYQAGHIYLIRPDAYVAGSAPAGDVSAIIAVLQRLRSDA
ncbi:FAD-dependent monooxygenase [Candidimonas nitroreducens]|uniref:Monooxygenase n=1 Tax=Candidimonas nitroreducens TaxID=683354 RepID=A0A225MG35_9BURK|nr:FAD-dependent monooxygenase [Candidimonas nitroreducens]OWT60214.1 monooxygenase [Candidimonas nitroreducens]